MPTTHRPAGRAAVIIGLLLAALLSIPAAASAATPDDDTGWIRAGHLSPGTPKADVRLIPYSSGKAVTLEGVTYGDVTDFQRVPAGLYTVSVVAAGSSTDATPMISETVRVKAGSASTVIATGKPGDVTARVLSDDLTPPPAGEARVRLVSAASSAPSVDAQVVDGPLLAEDVATGGSTEYATVKAQDWDIKVSADGSGTAPAADLTSKVTVQAGSVYTLLVLDKKSGSGFDLSAVKDSAGSTSAATGMAPKGGVDTGAGGLAREDAGRTTTLVGAGALLVLAATAGSVVEMRRRRAAVAR